jgi:glyoxylase-like metal-dependent hydrolase (beta-lactamase superfamily II)
VSGVRSILRFLLFLLPGVFLPVGAGLRADSPYFDIIPVGDGVYAVIGKTGVGGNAAIIINRDDVVVVDTHLRPAWAQDLIQQIRKMTDKPVRYVVNTHWHPDHTQGNQTYLNAFGPAVEFIAQHSTSEDIIGKAIPNIQTSRHDVPEQIAKMEKSLADGKDSDGKPLTDDARVALEKQVAGQKAYLGELQQMQIPPSTLTFEQSLYLHEPGGRTIEILNFGRGHTRGDAVVYLPKEKVVVTGDLLTGGIPFYRDSYPSHWVVVLESVQKLDWTVAIPGHGDVQQGKAQIGKLIAFMKDMVAQVTIAVANGKSLEETKKTVNLTSHAADFPFYKTPAAFQRPVDIAVERTWMEISGKIAD